MFPPGGIPTDGALEPLSAILWEYHNRLPRWRLKVKKRGQAGINFMVSVMKKDAAQR
jgi:hypothetical protein